MSKTIKTVSKTLLIIGVMFVCVKMLLLNTSCNAHNVNDTLSVRQDYHSYSDEEYIVLDFSSIYFIDTANMVLYYDNYDQFDMDSEYEMNPANINEDYNLMLHIGKDTLMTLINDIIRYMQYEDDWDTKYYIQSLYGIAMSEDSLYYVSYLGD